MGALSMTPITVTQTAAGWSKYCHPHWLQQGVQKLHEGYQAGQDFHFIPNIGNQAEPSFISIKTKTYKGHTPLTLYISKI